ncbi:MAG: flagellar basal body P-ring protein FlgI [Planctomycetes bacterium]|nr:flagellar basal body P-ring protein FlgI [Planctomycetota bacterium]
MKASCGKVLYVAGLLLAAGGCHENEAGSGAARREMGITIGALAEVAEAKPIVVEGYGLVGGLAGTGSAYCPPEVRDYLRHYIATQLPNDRVSFDEVLRSKNTAVVSLEATIPATPSMGEHFDVRVALLPGSEATSIQGGWLYKAELLAAGTFGLDMRPLATVDGQVFINPIGTSDTDARSGYVLGGGRTLFEHVVLLRLRKPNYRLASAIRNRLSERYGPSTARALSPGDIEVRIPADYRRRKPRFIALLPAMFVEVTQDLTRTRIDGLIEELTTARDKASSEIALEAVGRESLTQLATLVAGPDPEVRLRAGRVMLGLGDIRGLAPLRDVALDPQAPRRLEAIEAIMTTAKRADAITVAARLLQDSDVQVVLATYDYLRQVDDRAVLREVVGRSFLLEQVPQSSHRAVYVSRSGDPRVVLFGAPLRCRDSLFVETPDETIVLDARPGQGYVSVMRKHPSRPGIIGPVRSGPDVAELVRTLGGEPVTTGAAPLRNLGVPYAQVITVLEQLCAKDGVAAAFWAGPLPKIGLPVKK